MMNEFELAVLNLVKIYLYFRIFTFALKVLFFKRRGKGKGKYKGEDSTIISKIFVIISNPIKFKLDDFIRNQESCRKEKLSQEDNYSNANIIDINSKKDKKKA